MIAQDHIDGGAVAADAIGPPVFTQKRAILVDQVAEPGQHDIHVIEKPQNLVGKQIGELALYGHDAGVIPKGILSDDFGVKPEQSHWIIGGIDFPIGPIDFVSHPVPTGVEVEWVGTDVDLGAMLERGEIDALISADAPKAILEGSPKVGRLFEDYEAVERDYCKAPAHALLLV